MVQVNCLVDVFKQWPNTALVGEEVCLSEVLLVTSCLSLALCVLKAEHDITKWNAVLFCHLHIMQNRVSQAPV